MEVGFVLPDELKPLAGRITDADTHEMMPLQEWERYFGRDARPLIEAWLKNGETAETDKNHPNVPDFLDDSAEIDIGVLSVKGSLAPGASDVERRSSVMDAMGVSKQLMFSGGVGMYGSMLVAHEHDDAFMAGITEDRGKIGRRCVKLYQDWQIETAQANPRIRPVAPVIGDSLESLLAETRRLIDGGIRAIVLPAALPVAGLSPADLTLTPFWEMLEASGCIVTLHIGGQGVLFKSRAWNKAAPFEGFISLGEFAVDPWALSTLHLPSQNFLATMVTGGVFARHPGLRVGVMEVGAHWIGPLMELLDMWHTNLGFFNKNPHKLPEPPSSYIRSNVRATVFPFEPVELYIERYGMEDILAFATDYPHVEGGKDIFRTMYEKVARFGPEVVEKFFVRNGQSLMPN